MFALLSPRLWIALALAAVLAFTHLTAYRKGKATVHQEWEAAKVVQERAAQEQAARMRDLMRKAETRYVVEQGVRDRFTVQTVKEIVREAAPLADCPVPDALRVRLDALRACALGSAPASCGADGALPKP